MNCMQRILVVTGIMLAVVVGGCPNDRGESEKHDADGSTLTQGEHDHDGGEHSSEGRGEHA
jgi:hypothetical protein